MTTNGASRSYKNHSSLTIGARRDGHTNLIATTVQAGTPTVNSDSSNGFQVFDVWKDTDTGILYRCKDASVGAAVWEEFGDLYSTPNVIYVDGSYTGTSEGSASKPFKTISDAMTHIGTPSTGDEAKEFFVVDIAAGAYDEDVTTPKQRNITINCRGTVILGDGAADSYYNSTVARNLTIVNSADGEPVGGPSRYGFAVTGIRNADVSSTHIAYSFGNLIVSGDLTHNHIAPQTSHETSLQGVKVQGSMNESGVESGAVHNILLENCFFDNDVTTTANFNVVRSCEIDGLLTASTVGRFVECQLQGGVTAGVNDYVPPNGFFGCEIDGTITVTDLPVDGVTRRYIEDNGTTVTGSIVSIDYESSEEVLSDTSDPVATTNGFLGQRYVNVSTDKAYICVDATTDANVWQPLDTAASSEVVLNGTSDPTATTNGFLGQRYVNTDTKYMFLCSDATTDANVWERISKVLEGTVAPGVSTGNGKALGTLYIDTVADKVYILVDATTGANVWQEVGSGSGGASVSDWSGSTEYLANDLVVYKGLLFRVTVGHTSGTNFNENLDKVEGLENGVEVINQATHGLSNLDVIYVSGGSWAKALADAESTLSSPPTMVVETSTDYFVAVSEGTVKYTGHGLTVGGNYLSDSVAGGLTTTEPSTYGNPICEVIDANTIKMVNYMPYVSTDGAGSDVPILQPSVTSPANGATGTSYDSLSITGSPMYSDYGKALSVMEVEIFSDAGLTTSVYSNTESGSTSHTVTTTLSQSTEYWVRIRYQDVDGDYSAWSAANSFTTTATPISTPTITSPSAGSLQRDDTISVTSSAYSTSDAQTHASSSWKVTSDSSGNTAIDSVTDSVGDLTTWTADLSSAAAGDTVYFWVKHKGSGGDESAWSPSVSCTLTTSVSTASLTSPADAGSVTVDSTIGFVSSAFSSTVASETHASTDWQLTTSADTGFASPILSNLGDTVNLESYDWDSTGQLTDGNSYLCRCRHHGSTDSGDWGSANTITASVGDWLVYESGTAHNFPQSYANVAVDSDGNVYSTYHSSSFGTGSTDTVIVKHSSDGTYQWTKYWGDTGNDYLFGVAVDSADNVVVVGDTNSVGAGGYDMFVGKLTPAGAKSWFKYLGEAGNDSLYGVTVDSADNVIMVGYTTSVGAGNTDLFVGKLTSAGVKSWFKYWGGTEFDFLRGVAVDSTDNVVVVGETESVGAGGDDMFVGKLTPAGAKSWFKYFGGTGTDALRGVAVDSADNVVVSGYTDSVGAGGADMFVGKLTSAGAKSWFKYWGGTGGDYLYGVAIDSADNIIVAGYTNSVGAGSFDMFVGKLTSSGAKSWFKYFGGTSNDYLYGVAVDSTDNIIIAGRYNDGTNSKPCIGKCSSSGFDTSDAFINEETTWTVNDWAVTTSDWAVTPSDWAVTPSDWAITVNDLAGSSYTSLISY